jgi:glutamate racemase
LILGCTHYGILEKKIRKTIGVKINIINEGKIVAKKLKDYLIRHPEIESVIFRRARASHVVE